MRKTLISVAMSAAIMTAGSGAKAQVDLSAYADAEGFLDIQALTCAQLAGTWHRVGLPCRLARLGVKRRDKAADPQFAPRNADHNLAVGD